MPKSTIRVFYSPLSGRFYASQQYKITDGVVVVTGKKFDVTNDIGSAVTEHNLEFTKTTKGE